MNRDLLRTELRQRLADVLPPELDTDFCMDRWLESYDFKIDICVEKYNEYIRNRKVLGYDTPESLGKFYSRPEVVNFHRIFSLSTLDQNWINEMDNGIIFVEMGLQDPTKAVKSIRVADYASVFFGYCEYFQRMVVEQEKKSGKRSHGICIFDMELMSMLDYANPVAPINRLFESRVNIWMDYYGELLKRVVIVNPPRVVSLLFKMMSLLLPSKFLDRLSIAQKYPDDILKYIEKDAIPIETFDKERLHCRRFDVERFTYC
ncbi:CRAL/TRIO domain-containing protein [Ditylenchus destructor]|nr:CRAL/TRIO domain-containing protein [Ditylenchus destructor]